MTLLGVADRLLENPTVRQFLLAFDEKDWADVVQSAAVLGIQALLAKYGRGARLSDPSLLRAVARSVVRQGCWPFSIADAAEEPEEPPVIIPGPSGRPGSRKPVARKGPTKTRRGGRSVPPRVVAEAPTNIRAPARQEYGLIGTVTARPRTKSAPPDLGPPLKILQRKAAESSPQITLQVPGPAPTGGRLTESKLKAIAKFRQSNGNLSALGGAPSLLEKVSQRRKAHNESMASGANADSEGPEWYSRLMSRLQCMNSKLPGAEDAPRPPLRGEAPPTPPKQDESGLGGHRIGPNPALNLSGSRHEILSRLRLDVEEEAPRVLTTREARPPPQQPPTVGETSGAPLDGSPASMLLHVLPTRDERRELHAVSFAYDGPASVCSA